VQCTLIVQNSPSLWRTCGSLGFPQLARRFQRLRVEIFLDFLPTKSPPDTPAHRPVHLPYGRPACHPLAAVLSPARPLFHVEHHSESSECSTEPPASPSDVPRGTSRLLPNQAGPRKNTSPANPPTIRRAGERTLISLLPFSTYTVGRAPAHLIRGLFHPPRKKSADLPLLRPLPRSPPM
jgi:hypothetical protein